MYKGINVRNHNLDQLKKSKQFLQKIKAIPTINNNVNIEMIQNNNNQQCEDDDSQWADMQRMALIAKEKRMKNQQTQSATNLSKTNNYSQNSIIENQPSFKNFQNLFSGYVSNKNNFQLKRQYKQQQNNNQTDFEEKNSKIRLNQRMSKMHINKQKNDSFVTDVEFSQQNQDLYQNTKFEKNKINKKERRKNQNTKESQNMIFQNIIHEKNPNLVTVDQIKRKQSFVRNYRIGKQQQWQKNNKIEDYKLQFVLRKFPKIKDYRNNQKAIIKCSLLGNDVFVCMPTGGGKSLTFQAMTFIEKGVYLCILPLVSLIIDQEEQALKIGIKAFSLTGSKQIQDNKMIYQEILKYQHGADSIVVFCTPQKINKSPQFLNVLKIAYQNKALVKIVIDQVHCVSTWGKQFRQDYQNLSSLKQNFPDTPILGLTATVTQVIKQDIIKRLGIQNCYYFQSSFNRPNLYYQVRQKNKQILNNIIKIIAQHQDQSGIIYCVSRKDCEQMCSQLQSKRFKVAFYHANISQNDKRQIQKQWMQNKINIIIATIAFGMGINKPDVRFVIHHSLSKSLQNYYQESGRAGRDGQNAKCILFYRKSDKNSLQSLITKNQISKDENKSFCLKQLANMIKYCEDKFTCRRKFQLQYLGEKDFNVQQCNKTCDNCKKSLNFVEVQCIKQEKLLIGLLISIQRIKLNLSQNQIIMLCKGSSQKKIKYKLQQVQKNVDLGQIRQAFHKWTKFYIDQLITQLCSCEVFYEKIISTNTFKNNVVSNFYLKVNFSIANKFLQKVQTLPIKRSISKKNFKQTNNENSDLQFDFQQQVKDQNQNEQKDETTFQQDRYSFKTHSSQNQ